MSYTPVDLVEVFAWGSRVGAVTAIGQRNAYTFQYDPAWVRAGIDLAPILMPRRRAPYTFPGLSETTFHGLAPMLADSLPDAFGNGLIDAWMAGNGVQPSLVTPLDRLVYLGSRGMGALEYQPDQHPHAPRSSALDMGELILAARRAVRGTVANDDLAEASLQQIIDVGTSAGGARAKAVINLNPVSREIRSGHLPPEPGFEAWLLKFDGVGADKQLGAGEEYGRIEYAYSLMARAAGIEMSQTALLAEHDRAHFMTKRFDRVGAEKRHTQTLSGLVGMDFNAIAVNSYAQLFAAIQQLALPAETRTEAWRRMAFNVAAANNDDHAKNFSFLADREGTWSLSPAYDVTHAYSPDGRWTNQHLMGVNGKFRDIEYRDLLAVADRFDVPHAMDAAKRIREALESWPEFAAEAGVSRGRTSAIERDFQKQALIR